MGARTFDHITPMNFTVCMSVSVSSSSWRQVSSSVWTSCRQHTWPTTVYLSHPLLRDDTWGLLIQGRWFSDKKEPYSALEILPAVVVSDQIHNRHELLNISASMKVLNSVRLDLIQFCTIIRVWEACASLQQDSIFIVQYCICLVTRICHYISG